MDTRKIELLRDEEVVFQCDPAVLTNQRLLVSRMRGGDADPSGEPFFLRDIASFRKINGGQESRLKLGLAAGGGGGALVLAELVAPGLPELAETLLFLGGSLGLVGGVYFTLGSLLRVKPHTTLVFLVPGGRDIVVAFPGRDNPQADELTRRFTRVKRGL